MAQRRKSNWVRALSDAINLVTTAAAVIGLCGYGGYFLDQKLHTSYLTMIGVLLGVATAIKVMWDKMQYNARKEQQRKDRENNES